MRLFKQQRSRHGSIVPFLMISIVVLCGFVALAVDVGMLVVGRNMAQAAADVAAMTGARRLDGSPSSNMTMATLEAKAAAMANKILGTQITDSEIVIDHGAYNYDETSQTYSTQIPAVSPNRPNLTRATVTRSHWSAFARVWNINALQITATATATHRPRDVGIILDFSGSMNNESDIWNNEGYLGSANNSPNSTDPIYPQFGAYSDTANARMFTTSTDPRVGKCNVTQEVLGIPALVDDFYQHTRGATALRAFTPAPNSYNLNPAGDVPLKQTQDTGTNFARTANEVVANTTWDLSFELDGYDAYPASSLTGINDYADMSNRFLGYTQGPKYYGKTFFIWPPDPRGGKLRGSDATATRNLVRNWLRSLGYTDAELSDSVKGPKIRGIYEVTSHSGSRDWHTNPWPDTATDSELKAYLRTVPRPGSSINMTDSDTIFQRILRLHNRPNWDWRRRFFLNPGGSHPNFGGPLDDNTRLWDSSGNWRDPVSGSTTNYVINYQAILAWIRENATNPAQIFPTQLRAGRILYYDQIPTDVPASAYNWNNPNSNITDPNQRFWKEYIDYVLGVWRDPFNTVRRPGTPACSYGPDWSWGTIRISAKPTTVSSGFTLPRYMVYLDNPRRPRHRFWFGPMTMVQFISDTGLLPGTARDISMYPAKLGIAGALEDIRNNHPNDLVSLLLFNRPRFNGEPVEAGRFSQAYFGMSRDYTAMQNALWFPPNSDLVDVRPWDANGVQTPRAYGDYTANTTSDYGFMLAYNQYSTSSTLRSLGLGGRGRKGAQKLIIFETDGMANVRTNAGFVLNSSDPTSSYYQIGPSDSITTGSSPRDGVIALANRICAPPTGSVHSPGFATPRKSVIIHCVAFGAMVEPTAEGTDPINVFNLLRDVSIIGNTSFPASPTDIGHPDYYKLCIGTLEERKNKLRTAFKKIMDDGIAVALIR